MVGRFLIGALLVLALVPCTAGAVTAVTGGGGGVTPAVVDPANGCADGVDNDGDGRQDQADPGCTDNSPASEVFTGPPSPLTIARAKIIATQRISSPLVRPNFTRTLCRRSTPTRVWCSLRWSMNGSHGHANIRIWNYVDSSAKRIGTASEIRKTA